MTPEPKFQVGDRVVWPGGAGKVTGVGGGSYSIEGQTDRFAETLLTLEPEANADYNGSPVPPGVVEDLLASYHAAVAKAAEPFDPLPLDPADPEGDLCHRAMGLICNAHAKAIDDVTHEDGATPGWAPAARWWLDQYQQLNARRQHLKVLSAVALHQAALIAKTQLVVNQVNGVVDQAIKAGATEAEVRAVLDAAQARYTETHKEPPQ